MTSVILVKYAEIALKKRNRRDFERRLVENVHKAIDIDDVTVERVSGRIRITPGDNDQLHSIEERLAYVFGVHSFTRATILPADMDAVTSTAREYVEQFLPQTSRFAVKVRRTHKVLGESSRAVESHIGAVIQQHYPDLAVDLDNPDLTIYVEVRESGTYVYPSRNEIQGLGGMPVGTAGRGLALMSGGIDSPVAAWCAMKRGLSVDLVYFHSAPFTGEKAKEKVFDLARVLARYNNGAITVYTPSLARIQQTISQHVLEQYWTVLFRRSMHRIAEQVAERYDYQVTITGDSVAQVASQTVENLTAIDAASKMLTLRPLTGYDKREIMELSRRIGTYDISIRPYEDCCSVFTPDNPKTKATVNEIEYAESLCDLADHEQSSLAEMDVFEITPTQVDQ